LGISNGNAQILRLKRRKERNSTCSQTTKGIARKKTSMSYIGKGAGILWGEEYAPQRCTLTRKKTSMSYIGKGAGILWGEEYAPQRCTLTRKKMDNKRDSGNIYGLWSVINGQ